MYEELKDKLVRWIREWFEANGPESVAVLGLSGGKDSTVTASLCKEALGRDRVLGVLMPNGVQPDIDDSYAVVRSLDIPFVEININKAYVAFEDELGSQGITMTAQSRNNLPPRLRMSVLYDVAQSSWKGPDGRGTLVPINGRVANTCNLSETMTGWETRWGDQVGDFSPLGKLTKTEVVEIGKLCSDVPQYLVTKAPSDGLTGRTDEDNLGVTYDMIDRYIRQTELDQIPAADLERIQQLVKGSEFKRKSINLPTFDPEI